MRPRVLDESDRGGASRRHRVVEGPSGRVRSALPDPMFVVLGLAEERGGQLAEVRVRARRSRQRVEAGRPRCATQAARRVAARRPRPRAWSARPGPRRTATAPRTRPRAPALARSRRHPVSEPSVFLRRNHAGVEEVLQSGQLLVRTRGGGRPDRTRARMRCGVCLGRGESAAVVGHIAGHADTSQLPRHQQHGFAPFLVGPDQHALPAEGGEEGEGGRGGEGGEEGKRGGGRGRRAHRLRIGAESPRGGGGGEAGGGGGGGERGGGSKGEGEGGAVKRGG